MVRMYNTKYWTMLCLEERTLWVYLWNWRRDKAGALIQEFGSSFRCNLSILHLNDWIYFYDFIFSVFFFTCFFWIDEFVRIENLFGCWIFDEVICAISRYKLIQVRGNEIHKIFTANEIISEKCTNWWISERKNFARAQTSSAQIILSAIWSFCHESSVIALNRFADGLDASDFVWYQIRFPLNISSCIKWHYGYGIRIHCICFSWILHAASLLLSLQIIYH